eukprot:2451510-Amphidinium_carterae.1
MKVALTVPNVSHKPYIPATSTRPAWRFFVGCGAGPTVNLGRWPLPIFCVWVERGRVEVAGIKVSGGWDVHLQPPPTFHPSHLNAPSLDEFFCGMRLGRGASVMCVRVEGGRVAVTGMETCGGWDGEG